MPNRDPRYILPCDARRRKGGGIEDRSEITRQMSGNEMVQSAFEGFGLVTPDTGKNCDALLERVWGKMLSTAFEGHSLLSVYEEVDESRLSEIKKGLDLILIAYMESRASDVLRLRYGFIDGHRRTQAVVGRELGLSKTTIGRIETRAINRLRDPRLSQRLLSAVVGQRTPLTGPYAHRRYGRLTAAINQLPRSF